MQKLLKIPVLICVALVPGGQPVYGQSSAAPVFAEQPRFSALDAEIALALDSADFARFKAQKDPLKASLLNLIPFGVGSFQQADPVAAPVLATLDGVSAALLLYAVVAPPSSTLVGNAGQMLLGLGGLSLGRLIGLIAPWMHYNAALSDYVLQAQGAAFSYAGQDTSSFSEPLLTYSWAF